MGSPVAFIDAKGHLSLTLFGSSSDGCRPIPTAVEVVGVHQIRLKVDLSGKEACSADYSPTTSVVRLDHRVDVTADLRVDVIQSFGEMTFLVHPAG